MGGMTQTLTGAAMTEYSQNPEESLVSKLEDIFDPRWNRPATLGDLRNVLIRIDNKLASLRYYIDLQAFNTKRK
jgi:hypothetical protein